MALSSSRSHLEALSDDNSPFSLESAVQDLTIAMNDPVSSSICALRMRAAADRIQDELNLRKSATSLIKFSRSFPQLLRAGIRFLTLKQSIGNHNAMLEKLSECRCVYQAPTGPMAPQMVSILQHRPSRSRFTYYLPGLDKTKNFPYVMGAVETVCNLLTFTLSELSNGRFRNESSRSDAEQQQPWPQNEQDLLPYGCEDSINALDLWASKPGGWAVLRFCTALAAFHQPFAHAIFRPPQYTFVLRRPIEHVTAMVELYEQVPPSDFSRNQPDLDAVLQYTFNYWQILISHSAPRFKLMLNSQKSVLCPILARFLPILNAKVANTADTMWSEMRHFALSMLLLNSSPDPNGNFKYQDLDINLGDIFGILNNEAIVVENYVDLFVNVRKGGCFNIACPSLASETAVYAKLCSKCRLVRFCSEKCQKEAWKNRGFPHKILCSKSFALKERLSIKDWADFGKVRDTSVQDFIALCKRKGVSMQSFLEVGAMLHGMYEAQSIYQQKILEVKAASKN